jgi:uncharacterized membrane protein YozB (DUF420 family)
MEEYMLPCLNKKLFGIDCFGCGTQRSLALLLKGDFVGAFTMYPAIFTTILFFIAVGLHFIDKSRNYHKAIIGLAITNAIIMVVSYFYRVIN